ncbi:MAG: DUF4215 domain-containing protein, partial [Myxococcales bacterium]|nr:DUF4215 domain-containing protein [Myxococcales bacterium]
DEGEECDDGNDVDDDECSNACIVNAVCGDGVMEGAEECDDGNEIEDDGCTSECLLSEYCGNGVVEEPEKCDDGNDVPMDGCEDNCIPSEPGDCGNGVAEWNEPCDDGNEINDDGCQNDCELTPDPACQPLDGDDDPYAPCDDALVKNQELAPFQALDLACSDLVNQAVFVDDHQFMSNNPNAWQIASGYGSFATMGELKYSPRKGDAMLVLSTGTVAAPNPQGVVLEQPNSQGANGENNNDDTNQLPSAINPVNGSNNGQGGTPFEGCDGFGDCSDTLAAQWGLNGDPNDKLWFRFEATPPPGTAAYSMHLVLCSSEWPVFVNTPYNDLLIIWQVSDEYTGNVTYLNGQALSITSLNDYILTEGYVFADPELGGTGFEGHACTDWLTVKHNVTPDGPLEMTFFLADIGDSILATVALLDGFRWECDACTPGDSLACMSDLPGADCCGVAVPG